MFNAQVGGQVAWLLPAAAVSLAAGLWLTRRAPPTDRARAGWILFGAWALVHVAVFSTQEGIFHPYYVSALAPAVAALAGAGAGAGAGAVGLWRWARASWAGLVALDAAILAVGTGLIAYLQAHQGSAKYLVAATGAQTTAGIILATGEPVVTIGGFSGQDPAPTVAELAKLVAGGDLKYVLLSGGGVGMGGPGGSSSSDIATWVKAHSTAIDDAGTSSGTLYRVSA